MNNIAEKQKQPSAAAETQQRPRGFVTPPSNIMATDDGYLVEVDMPGVDKSGLEITVEANELTIIGRRNTDTPKGELLYWEAPMADYRRVFDLGPDIDSSKISAEMHQGVLCLRLPKSERAKPKKIEVKAT